MKKGDPPSLLKCNAQNTNVICKGELYIMQDNINGVETCSKRNHSLTLIIDVQQQVNTTWQGVLIRKDMNRRHCFRSALELVRIIDFLLCPDAIKDNEALFDLPIITSNGKKKATFVVEIMYQQHTTWQGLVTWIDKGKKQFFRSTLELMRLIDSALITSDAREFVDKLETPKFPFSKKLTIDELEAELSGV